jgi:hypothetical protein
MARELLQAAPEGVVVEHDSQPELAPAPAGMVRGDPHGALCLLCLVSGYPWPEK